MTTREKLEGALMQMGLFNKQASAIIERCIPIIDFQSWEAADGYDITWDSPAEDYPSILYNIWMATVVKKVALKWIDKNIPQAWYREMFVEEETGK